MQTSTRRSIDGEKVPAVVGTNEGLDKIDDGVSVQGAGKTLEQVKSLLSNAPSWLKTNDDLLRRLANESDDFIKKVNDYYKNAIPSNTPSGFNGEGVYSGVKFNKYGHPELTPHVSSPDHIVKIEMKGNYTSDMTDAKNKLVQQAFGGDASKVRKSIDPNTGNQSSGWSPFQIKQADGSWSEPYTWHHHQDGSSMYPVKKSHWRSFVNPMARI